MTTRLPPPVHDMIDKTFKQHDVLGECAGFDHRQRNWHLLVLWVVLIGLLSLASANTAAAARIVGDPQSALSIEVGQGRLLNFNRPVTSVFVADPKIADVKVVSPTWVYVFGTTTGTTNLMAMDGQTQVRASMRLRVNASTDTATNALAANGQGRAVRLRTTGNQLIVDGYADDVGDALDAQTVINQNTPENGSVIDRQIYKNATQINIRVRFAEVSRNKLRQYGVNWDALVNSGSFTFGLLTGDSIGGGAGAANTVSGSYTDGGDAVQTILNALQTNGLVRILAEPNITTMTGQAASFLAGGEIPIPVPVNDELVGIQYKRYGVSLLCTPTLLPNGRIDMDVQPEVSSIVNGQNVRIAGYDVPTLQVRSADTNVQVGSGQTFAIAGLFQRNDSNDLQQLPIIGDIPVLGALFRSRRFQQQETELVMLITPYLVKPDSDREPSTPLDRDDTQNKTRALPRRVSSQSDFGFYER